MKFFPGLDLHPDCSLWLEHSLSPLFLPSQLKKITSSESTHVAPWFGLESLASSWHKCEWCSPKSLGQPTFFSSSYHASHGFLLRAFFSSEKAGVTGELGPQEKHSTNDEWTGKSSSLLSYPSGDMCSFISQKGPTVQWPVLEKPWIWIQVYNMYKITYIYFIYKHELFIYRPNFKRIICFGWWGWFISQGTVQIES